MTSEIDFFFFNFGLTRLTWLINASFLSSNWNLDKIFALTIRWIRSSTYSKKKSDFHRLFLSLNLFPPFYEEKWIRIKWLPHGDISKILLLIFRPKFSILCTDSILRVKRCISQVGHVKSTTFISKNFQILQKNKNCRSKNVYKKSFNIICLDPKLETTQPTGH